MSGGFLLGGKPKQKSKESNQQAKDLTHIKAKPKEEQYKLEEVQQSMKSVLEQNKTDWLNEDFFKKLQSSPKLLKAFQNPQYMQAFSEFGNNPQEAMKKYGNNPEFRELMNEFSKLMGTHFEDVADKKSKEEEEKVKNDPVTQIIENDPMVKDILQDPKVKKILDHLRYNGALDLHDVMQKDEKTGRKLQTLIQKGVLNANSSLPV